MLLSRVSALKDTAMRLSEKVFAVQGLYNIMYERGVQQIKKSTTKDPNMMTTCQSNRMQGNFDKNNTSSLNIINALDNANSVFVLSQMKHNMCIQRE